MKKNIESLIKNFKNLKVLVIGDAILDIYTKGVSNSISREAPVMVLNVQEREYRCGGAANTAINVAALGAETYFLTILGKDAHARELLTVLRKNKVHTEYILTDSSRTTIAKQRLIALSNILLRTDEGSCNEITSDNQKILIERISSLYPRIDAIILSDYGYGLLSHYLIKGIKAIMQRNTKPLVVDAKDLSKFRELQPAAVKPNFDETQKLLDITIPTETRLSDLLPLQDKILSLSGARLATATLDTDGVMLFEKGKRPYHISCIARDNTNTIGAGDTFTAALTLALSSKTDAGTATEIAAAAAAMVVQKNGTAVCSNSELIECFTPQTKVLPLKQLVKIVQALKKQHKKIVFTNGCFDILHKGHIALLNEAGKSGDVLIVGVNSDKSIRALKGAGRPINTLNDRIAVLSGLQSVHYLVSFDEHSAEHLISSLQPDIFVKGGNYTPHTLPEMPVLKRLQCTVKIIPYIEDFSTREIIDRIRHSSSQFLHHNTRHFR